MSRFLDAARHRSVDVTPIWLMRQAGRSLPEYRKLRERWSLVDIVAQPELCAEVTLQPVRRLGVDAAVMFADIMLPLRGMGVEFELVENVGPVIARPISSGADVDRLIVPLGEEAAPQVITAIRNVVAQSPVPVIGFSGAPFTLASYLIEGRPSRDFARVKEFMYSEPAVFDRLLAKLSATMAGYLKAQVAAGVKAVQLFDSWVGALALEDYEARVLQHTRTILEALRPLDVPRIHFGTDTAALLESIASAGPDVVSLDWRVPLDVGWARIGHDRGIQGNLDPAVLLGPPELVKERASAVLRRAGGKPGHIFNLGHGVLPSTPLESLQLLIETVHEWQVARVA
ncbi:MAG: uroporphyrinogen decarboxylase [Candidatus Dormibacteraeota bacterium]|nr:uroporphyrinogen decarboxylase [Candidatus Dormibacteraeota bacterium]